MNGLFELEKSSFFLFEVGHVQSLLCPVPAGINVIAFYGLGIVARKNYCRRTWW